MLSLPTDRSGAVLSPASVRDRSGAPDHADGVGPGIALAPRITLHERPEDYRAASRPRTPASARRDPVAASVRFASAFGSVASAWASAVPHDCS